MHIALEHVSVRFGAAEVLHDITLEVPAGAVTAVIGGDGAGKSTLLRLFTRRVAPSRGRVQTLDRARLGYQPATSGVWPAMSVAENVAFVGESYGMRRADIRARGDALLDRADLSDARNRLGRDLSGGMRQKLGFVLAMLHSPEVVLLDEPSTGVDPVSRVDLWRLIAEEAAAGVAVLLATTYLDEAERASAVLALDAGHTLARGTASEIVAGLPGTVIELAGGGEGEQPPAVASWRRGAVRHAWLPAGALAPRAATAVTPDLEDALIALTLERGAGSSDGDADADAAPPPPAPAGLTPPPNGTPPLVHASGTPPLVHASRTPLLVHASGTPPLVHASGTPLLVHASRVTKRFGDHIAVDDMHLDVRPGEIVGLIGANGAGKTTFLRTLIGLERADAGEISLFPEPAQDSPRDLVTTAPAQPTRKRIGATPADPTHTRIGSTPIDPTRKRIGYVPQGLGLYANLSVDENVAFVCTVYDAPRPALPPSLQAVHTEPVGRIGLGRQRRLAFLLAIAHHPDLLVLDEPTSGVDPLARARLWDTVREQAQAGVGVIVTTHYLQEAEQCDRLALMADGRLVGEGRVADLTAGERAVVVVSADWRRVFTALDAAHLPVMLSGTDVRVAGETPSTVSRVLDQAGVRAEVRAVAPTLEETMVLRGRATDRAQSAAARA